ncbi:hypothetical protein E2C01_024384 [Portunus trituberculatus]|uniref:Uncharacterized protein n=1 Tax=Portunus trituberculatus TaxID=210409 RepID=A0A5B7ECJ7_PORTR|nr:hypothetical protein [Portunus trituberculatus]
MNCHCKNIKHHDSIYDTLTPDMISQGTTLELSTCFCISIFL